MSIFTYSIYEYQLPEKEKLLSFFQKHPRTKRISYCKNQDSIQRAAEFFAHQKGSSLNIGIQVNRFLDSLKEKKIKEIPGPSMKNYFCEVLKDCIYPDSLAFKEKEIIQKESNQDDQAPSFSEKDEENFLEAQKIFKFFE